jgi:hypothetical protein
LVSKIQIHPNTHLAILTRTISICLFKTPNLFWLKKGHHQHLHNRPVRSKFQNKDQSNQPTQIQPTEKMIKTGEILFLNYMNSVKQHHIQAYTQNQNITNLKQERISRISQHKTELKPKFTAHNHGSAKPPQDRKHSFIPKISTLARPLTLLRVTKIHCQPPSNRPNPQSQPKTQSSKATTHIQPLPTYNTHKTKDHSKTPI